MIYEGTIDQFRCFQQVASDMDPNRTLKWEVSSTHVHWCDLTIHKGVGHALTGRLDTCLYQKPTDRGLYLPRNSHHHPSTYSSIMSGEALRLLRLSSDYHSFVSALHCKYKQFRARGYTPDELFEHLIFKFNYTDRNKMLHIQTTGATQVLALKIPYTGRARQLQISKLLQQLKQEAEADPALNETVRHMRWVVAYQKTRNLTDLVKLW